MRALYALGLLYIALCGGLIWLGRAQPIPVMPVAPLLPVEMGTTPHPAPQISGPEWFQRMKPFCNPVEVETRVRFEPPLAATKVWRMAPDALRSRGKPGTPASF